MIDHSKISYNYMNIIMTLYQSMRYDLMTMSCKNWGAVFYPWQTSTVTKKLWLSQASGLCSVFISWSRCETTWPSCQRVGTHGCPVFEIYFSVSESCFHCLNPVSSTKSVVHWCNHGWWLLTAVSDGSYAMTFRRLKEFFSLCNFRTFDAHILREGMGLAVHLWIWHDSNIWLYISYITWYRYIVKTVYPLQLEWTNSFTYIKLCHDLTLGNLNHIPRTNSNY